ncbi:MAG: fatty acid desaturase [Gammaproteobacteria bacterium]|nr:fatty acid desaturase [Gammaproteobacteria bacterium]
MLFGLFPLSFMGYVAVVLVFTQITIAAVTIFLHRAQAHRSVILHPIISHFFRFWLWLTTGMVTKEWAAIHRKHHAKCETTEDPHSPQTLGLKTVMWYGTELYRKASKDKEIMARYGHGTPDDWIERHLYTKHSAKGVVLMFLVNLVLFGLPGITIWALQMAWIPFFAAGLVNGVGHYWGYRNFECRDASRNLFPWGFWIGGEELHNNHHTYPTSAKLSVKWWEFDMGWAYIRLLSFFGLAKPKKLPPRLVLAQEKLTIDLDTVKAFITHRFQILARYSKEVVLPVLSLEKQRANNKASWRVLDKAKQLLTRSDALVDATGKYRLKEALDASHALEQVYQYRQKLNAIWDKTTFTQKELIEALQQWCHQAEASGLDVLKTFSLQLRRVAA